MHRNSDHCGRESGWESRRLRVSSLDSRVLINGEGTYGCLTFCCVNSVPPLSKVLLMRLPLKREAKLAE
jgi:hypothetical protein